jgi:ATP-dependent RNA helicase DDX49/DBP8
MTSLFGQTKRKSPSEENQTEEVSVSLQDHEVSSGKMESKYQESYTFQELGLIDWICQTCRVMGFKRPTPIQQACIPAILEGRNVMGCAETGSGKTAAFALPMLQHLSEDPYGIFGIILTPTRELAVQIQEQVIALGAPISVRTCLVIGGLGIIDQGIALSRRPHLIIATPGRLRHHLESADPPDISRARFLVLDEADRLLSVGFESELLSILNRMTHPRRQTLLFSATLTTSLEQLEDIASLNGTLRFDLT